MPEPVSGAELFSLEPQSDWYQDAAFMLTVAKNIS